MSDKAVRAPRHVLSLYFMNITHWESKESVQDSVLMTLDAQAQSRLMDGVS